MKKILSLILAATLCVFGLSTIAAAETTETSFSMITNTGIINLVGENGMEMEVEPDIIDNDYVVLKTNDTAPEISSVKLVVEGEKYGRTYSSKTEYTFKNYFDADCEVLATSGVGDYWKLEVYSGTAPAGQFLIDSYSYIYSIKMVVTGAVDVVKEQEYYNWGSTVFSFNNEPIFTVVKDFETNGAIIDILESIIGSPVTFKYSSKIVKTDYPFLPNTDFNYDGVITRDEVVRLSYSEYGIGKGLEGFEGLTSQVGTFFNKQTNGKITFKVTTSPAVLSNTWVTGGVPSTQVGFYNPFSNSTSSLVGLFFNYENTGSLVAPATINADGEIVFDISDVLDAIGGNALASIRSISYGLIGGLTYDTEFIRGLKIERVTLSYNTEDAVAETTVITTEPEVTTVVSTEDTTTTTTTEVIEEVDETEEPLTDDEGGAEIVIEPEETTTTTTVTAEPVIIVEDPEPTIIDNSGYFTGSDDDDENPGTGVSLVLGLPIASVLIGLISRKRK